MINNLTCKILLALFALIITFCALVSAILIYSSEKHEREVTQRIHSELAGHVVDNYLLYKDGKPDYAQAKQTFHDLMILGANFEFYLLDKHGSIVAHDGDPQNVVSKKVNLSPINKFVASRGHALVLGEDPKNAQRKKVFSAAPIYQMGEVYGYLYVVIGSQAHDELANEVWYKNVVQSSLGLLGLALTLFLLCLAFTVFYITKPLNRLIKQVRSVKAQGFEQGADEQNASILSSLKNWPSDSHNDIDILGHAFYETLQELQNQYDNIVSIDDLRKELLSHVSHDLRTPLASLLLYLETWELQFDQISKEKSREYIATAKVSAKKIASLIEQLFELAHLDGNNVTVRKEPVVIAELIQDVLQKFSLSAHDQGVSLDVEPKDSSIIVHADIEKLERVFTNLVENALRHTPAGGDITVNIQRSSGFVSIDVKDTGIGIPEKDLPHIFDPHFKAGNSVRENTAHGGLGLAITKKLLELHQTKIRVASQINRGTTFSFALQSEF